MVSGPQSLWVINADDDRERTCSRKEIQGWDERQPGRDSASSCPSPEAGDMHTGCVEKGNGKLCRDGHFPRDPEYSPLPSGFLAFSLQGPRLNLRMNPNKQFQGVQFYLGSFSVCLRLRACTTQTT